MCSTTRGQLGRICRAIEELAARSSGAADPDAAADPAPRRGGGDHCAARDGTAGQERQNENNSVPESQPETAADPRPAVAGDADLVARLAAIWEMVAAADPELAKRLPGYLSAAE